MQIFAFNEKHQLCSAQEAIGQRDYVCIECNSIVRVRKGAKKIAHFYHLSQANHCFLSRKSLVHIAAQEYFLKHLPEGEAFLEVPFPDIKRIADVVWVNKKLIFEIQCSFIDEVELLARNQDYLSVGYDVIWVLHDKRYNKRRLSSAEVALKDFPHYYTNINSLGKGLFYDQWSVVNKAVRQYHIGSVPINFNEPLTMEGFPFDDYPSLLKERQSWKWYFQGDLFYRFSKLSPEALLNSKTSTQLTGKYWRLFQWIKTAYLRALHYGLKKWVQKF